MIWNRDEKVTVAYSFLFQSDASAKSGFRVIQERTVPSECSMRYTKEGKVILRITRLLENSEQALSAAKEELESDLTRYGGEFQNWKYHGVLPRFGKGKDVMNYSASCSCGKIKVTADFPSRIEEYQARECDCDFCTSRGLAYLSDVNGTISFSPKETMNQVKQGSCQATFWECDNCHDVVAVTNKKNGVVRGAVSKRLFAQHFKLKPSVTVSPKNLSASEKSDRWPTVWSKVI